MSIARRVIVAFDADKNAPSDASNPTDEAGPACLDGGRDLSEPLFLGVGGALAAEGGRQQAEREPEVAVQRGRADLAGGADPGRLACPDLEGLNGR